MRFKLTSMTAAEVAELRARLSHWVEPEAFAGAVSAALDELSFGEFFNVPALGFLRDAWTLGRFGTLTRADAVRLAEGSFPDGHARLAGRTLDVEITEAIMPGRRRGQEFLPGSPQMREDPGEDWDRRIDALPGVLRSAIERKAAKSYATPPTLLVYLNITAYRHRERECLYAIEREIAAHRAAFADLYVLWDGELFGGSAHCSGSPTLAGS